MQQKFRMKDLAMQHRDVAVYHGDNIFEITCYLYINVCFEYEGKQ